MAWILPGSNTGVYPFHGRNGDTMDHHRIDWRKEWVNLSGSRKGIAEFIIRVRSFLSVKYGVQPNEVSGKRVVLAILLIDKAAPVSWNAKDKMIVIR